MESPEIDQNSMSSVPENIIVKYLQGAADVEETELLRRWLAESEENAEIFFRMQEIWDSGRQLTDDAISRGWDTLNEKIGNAEPASPAVGGSAIKMPDTKPQRFKIGRLARYAAAIAIGFVVAAGWFGRSSKDGSNGTTVVQNAVYGRFGVQHLILPDSSSVWLSAGGSLTYPERFRENVRSVALTGKAYFDVRKTGRTFTVQSDNIEVEVTGTEFQVENLDESEILVTLVSGKVSVNVKNGNGATTEIIPLVPGKQARISKSDGNVQIADIDPEYYAAWKDGTYRFNDESLERIAEQLSKHYRMEIRIDPKLKENRFTGRITHDMNIGEVMKIINASRPVKYKQTSNGIYISEK